MASTGGNAFIVETRTNIASLQESVSRFEQLMGTINVNLQALDQRFINHEVIHDPYLAKIDQMESNYQALKAQVYADAVLLNKRIPALEEYVQELKALRLSMENECEILKAQLIQRVPNIELKLGRLENLVPKGFNLVDGTVQQI